MPSFMTVPSEAKYLELNSEALVKEIIIICCFTDSRQQKKESEDK